jgi:membrane-bound serine protease (ClpP class)
MTPESSTSVDRRIADLVGHEGITSTPLRPSGMATIDGRKVDVVTLGDYIDKDVPVRVVDNSGNRVVVRQADSRKPTT